MKKLPIILFLLLFSASLFAQVGDFGLDMVHFENRSGQDIWYIFMSTADTQAWGPDLLGDSGILDHGDTKSNYFRSDLTEPTLYDFMAIDGEGNIYEAYRIPLYDQDNRIEIRPYMVSETLDSREFNETSPVLTVDNQTGLDIWYLFISPVDSQENGLDLMDSELWLEASGETSFFFHNAEQSLEYNLVAFDEEGGKYSLSLTLNPHEEFQRAEISSADRTD